MRYPWWRLAVFLLAAGFPLYLFYQAWIFALGPDPGKVLVDSLGQGALVLLLITLSMTPLQALTGWSGWMAVRRQLGLWSFACATLHLAAYLYLLLGLDFALLGEELRERPYILVGALAWLGLVALALTSSRWSMRKLGKRWRPLHRLIYPILLLVLLHMLWVVRADARAWALYAGVGTLLLAFRLEPLRSLLKAGRRERAKGGKEKG